MANIGLSLHNNASVDVIWINSNANCIGISIECDLPAVEGGSGHPIPFARDNITLHGTPDEMRAFAEKIISALSAYPVVRKRETDASAELARLEREAEAGRVAH